MSLEEFKRTLAQKVQEAKSQGIPESTMKAGIIHLADVVMNFDKPATQEEALVQELWNEANAKEKEILAGLVLRLAGEDFK